MHVRDYLFSVKSINDERAREAAAALNYLADMKIVHADIGLRNLLVSAKSMGSSKYEAKIADFGMR